VRTSIGGLNRPVGADEMVEPARVRAAHGDAWEAEGRARIGEGGGATRVRGARLMASGLPYAQWNNGDVTDADVDEPAMRAWYAERGVPWGIRVPLDLTVDIGTPLFVKRCFGLHAGAFLDDGSERDAVAVTASAELERFAEAEAAVFGGDVEVARRWVRPVFGLPGFEHWVAEREGHPAAIASTVWSDGDAGPAVMVTGIGAVDAGGQALVGTLLSALLQAAFDRDADVLVHSHTSPDDDPSVLTSLGFVEVPGFLVRLVVPE
jgi:hypothetical protein